MEVISLHLSGEGRGLTTARNRPRISAFAVVSLAVAQLDARRVMPGVALPGS